MIRVNENLLKGYKGAYKVEGVNVGVPSDNYNRLTIDMPDTLEENQKYTFCFKFKQFNGSGKFTVRLFNKDNSVAADRVTFNVSDERFYFNFTYRAGITDKILIYTDIAGATRGVSAEIKDIMIVDGYYEKIGDEVVYLPHKENLPEGKQALLPPEGNYKEIQAL